MNNERKSECLLTIVIPSLNQGKYLEECIESVINLDINKKIIIIDGGSKDESLRIIKKYENFLEYWESKPDKGQTYAINRGVDLAKTEFVSWLNSDDIFLNGFEDFYKKIINETKKYPVFYGKSVFIDNKSEKIGKYLTHRFFYYLLTIRCFISQPSTVIRRDCWNKINGIDNSYKAAFDYELWWKLFKNFGEFKFIPIINSATRLHKETKSNQMRKIQIDESTKIVQHYNTKVPIKWYLYRIISLYFRKFIYKY